MTEQDAIDRLAALLDGETDAAEADESLGALLTLADTVRQTADVAAPTPEFRASLRDQLLAEAATPPGLVERTRVAWRTRTAKLRASARVAVATVTASSMIGSAGVAVAAQEALPGDLLYGIKGVTEDARLLLATDDVAEARLHLVFAEERLRELDARSAELTTEQVVALLDEMDSHSQAGAQVLIDAAISGFAGADEVNSFTEQQRSGLTGVINSLPLLAKPVAEDSLELLRRIQVNAAGSNPQPSGARDDGGLSLTCPRCGATTTESDGADEADRPRRPLRRLLDGDDGRSGITINLPGEGPALPDLDCDCIELPGGREAREPVDDEAPEQAPSEPTGEAPRDEPEEPPFQPGEGFSDPDADSDEDDDTLDAPTSLEQLPLEDLRDTVEDVTDIESGVDLEDIGDRATEGIEDLLGP